MASAIEPGMWVEKVSGDNGPDTFIGRVYRVEEVQAPGRLCEGCDGSCVGLRFPGFHRWKSGCCYRPIYRPSADLIESLKQPAPEAVRELIGAEG